MSPPISGLSSRFLSPISQTFEKSKEEEKVQEVSSVSFSRKRSLEASLSSCESPLEKKRLKIEKNPPKKISFADGEIYEGETDEDGKCHGKGKVVHPDGDYYEGEFFHGLRHGFGKACLNGAFYEGSWKEDQFDGFGHKIDGKNRYKGSWKDGKPNGLGVTIINFGEKGQLTYWGHFKDGLRHGLGVMLYPDGSTSRGRWENDKACFDEKAARIASLPKNSEF